MNIPEDFKGNTEAFRCLMCKNARCSAACPVSTDVPAAMALYRKGETEAAARMLFWNNPLSAITAKVCDWERLCMGHCIMGIKSEPVKWHCIEDEISSGAIKGISIPDSPANGKSVGIIGAGPAGIAAAIWLLKDGFKVMLYDIHERIGGVLRYGIPDFRLDKSILDEYERILFGAGAEFKGNVNIGKDITVNDIRSDHDAVLIAGGAWKPRLLDIPGEDNPDVLHALDYLEDPSRFSLKEPVLVIGGGNVTMDACRTARRAGFDTTVYYRKDFPNMPANRSEIQDALEDGVKFMVFEVPVEIGRDDEGNFAIMRKCENVVREDGRLSSRIISGTDRMVRFGTMITAISENVDYDLFSSSVPETDSHGWIVTDIAQETSQDGVFLAGDFLSGPSTVVAAVASAKKAVEGIKTYLSAIS